MQIFRPEMLYNIFVMHLWESFFFVATIVFHFHSVFHQLSSVLVVAVTNTAESWMKVLCNWKITTANLLAILQISALNEQIMQ